MLAKILPLFSQLLGLSILHYLYVTDLLVLTILLAPV